MKFCKDCKYFKERDFFAITTSVYCNHPNNKTYAFSALEKTQYHIFPPHIKNKDNNCPDFERGGFFNLNDANQIIVILSILMIVFVYIFAFALK